MERLVALSEVFRKFAESEYVHLVPTIAKELTKLIGEACIVSLGDGRAACDSRRLDTVAALEAALAQRSAHGYRQQVAETGQPIMICGVPSERLASAADPAFAPLIRQHGVHSMLVVPLEARGERLGAVSLYRCEGTEVFIDEDRTFALMLAECAALALVNARLVDALQRERGRAMQFVALVETSNEMIAMADFAGQVLYINPAGRALCGIPADVEAHTMTLGQFHTEQGLSRAPIVRERGSWQGEGVLRHFQTGELIPTQVSTFLVRDERGEPFGFATVQRDLRETKRLEDELRQSQKMEALGRLAGGVAHDFNNLLTVILSYSAMLAKTMPAGSRNARDVEQIARAGERAAELTQQLLAFSRRQVLEPKTIELGAAVHAMEEMIRRIVGEDIELRIVTAADVPAVLADAGQVEQVVMNLVVNARDAMERGGVLTLETARAGEKAVLSVTDTGVGIDESIRAKMFEPFFTTKDRGKGTGLGLSTVMGIVEQSGGSVSVDSAPGRGTTFRVVLPASNAPPSVAVARTVTQSRGTGRILLAEDEREVRILVRDVLREAGYEVVEAADGESALALAVGHFDLLLTDVIMPRMSGRQLAAKFLALRPEAIVLYMSGYPDDKLGAQGVLDADVELIQKPLTPDSLLRRVRALLLRSR